MATQPLKSKSGLPRKMHLSYGRYFIVHLNKWIPLSRSLPEALRLYADWIQAQEQTDSNIRNLVDEYALILASKSESGKLAKKTARNYKLRGDKFANVFKNAGHITEIEHSDIYTWRETFELSGQHAMWNLTHSYLKGFFQWCKDKSHAI